jgi:hypothetical protein
MRIVVKDTYNNTSELQFSVQRGSAVKNRQVIKPTSYGDKDFHPGFINVFEKDDIQVIVGEDELYDSVNFAYSKKPSISPLAVSDMHIVQSGLVPLNGYFIIRLKSNPGYRETIGKLIIQRTWGGKTDVQKPGIEGDWYTGRFRNFGNFQLLLDNSPPVITPIGIRENANLSHQQQIIFVVTDNNDEIKNFRAELDGKWLRFTNDKGRSFIYKFDEMCPPGNHELKVSVEDEAGNSTTKNFHFTR